MSAMSEALNGGIGRRAAAALALACVFGLGVVPARAVDRDLPDIKAADAVLHEVRENMLSFSGNCAKF
jgi:hypothetical protein